MQASLLYLVCAQEKVSLCSFQYQLQVGTPHPTASLCQLMVAGTSIPTIKSCREPCSFSQSELKGKCYPVCWLLSLGQTMLGFSPKCPHKSFPSALHLSSIIFFHFVLSLVTLTEGSFCTAQETETCKY